MEMELESAIQADELLEQIAAYEAQIKSAEDERDAFISHYENKILAAKDICERKTKDARESIALLTESLRRYAETQVTDKKRSVRLPSGTLSFRKQPPRFFFDDLKEASATDGRLIHFVKHNAHEFLKVNYSESVDWQNFKRKLTVTETGDVAYSETGEPVDGLHAQTLPDKFTVKML